MAEKTHKGGKKNRKWGRNKESCKRYRAEGRREINKALRAERHAKRMVKQAEKVARRKTDES